MAEVDGRPTMKSKRFKVDCDHFYLPLTDNPAITAQRITWRTPICDLKGSANDPTPLVGLFVENCAKCEHNRWPKEE